MKFEIAVAKHGPLRGERESFFKKWQAFKNPQREREGRSVQRELERSQNKMESGAHRSPEGVTENIRAANHSGESMRV